LKRKTKDKKFLFSQTKKRLENKELKGKGELKKIEKLSGESQKSSLLSILKILLRVQRQKEKQKLKNGKNECERRFFLRLKI